MQFNEFNRRLDEMGLDPRLKYILSFMFEALMECLKQGDQNAQVMLALTNSLKGAVDLQERDRDMLKQMLARGAVDGVTVESVQNDPDEKGRSN